MLKPLKFLISISALIIAILFLLSRFDITDILLQISQLNIFSLSLAGRTVASVNKIDVEIVESWLSANLID